MHWDPEASALASRCERLRRSPCPGYRLRAPGRLGHLQRSSGSSGRDVSRKCWRTWSEGIYPRFGALGGSASLEDGWKIWSETPLADVCRIGIETSLEDDGGLGAATSIADVWRIGVETSLAGVLRIGTATSLVGVGGLVTGTSLGDIRSIGAAISLAVSWRGTETPVAWHVIGTDGPSPFAADTDVPDSAKIWFGLCIKHNGSRCKSASMSSALSPSRSVS